MRTGIFITFEGPEGSGKSTHIALLADHLRAQNRKVLVTRQPGGTPLAASLRSILLDSQDGLSPVAELFLYEADRAQHSAELIEPALRRGELVLCDRYTDSTLAYQGFGRGLEPAMIRTLNKLASGDRSPDLTILLDVPVARGLSQARQRKNGHDRLERAGLAFHRRVRKGFLTLAAREPRRFRVIEQQDLLEKTQELVRGAVDDYLAKRKR